MGDITVGTDIDVVVFVVVVVVVAVVADNNSF